MKRLPKNWRLATVADVCDMRNGHGFGPEDWDATGLPIIRIQNLNGGLKFDYFSGVPDDRWLVEPGQMLFSWAGTKGVSFGPTIWRGKRGVLNQHIFKVQPKAGIDGEWLYWALKQVTARIEAQSHGFKATLVHVKKSDIDRQPITVPTPDEQRRIAQILSTWDQAIATTERLLANGRAQWRALIHLTLHLPSANLDAVAPADNGGFPASVQPGIPTLPPAPAGWRRIQLREHLQQVRRPVALEDDASYRLVTVKRSRGGVELRDVLRGAEVKTPSQFYVQANDFLISKRQIVHGACGIVPPELDGAVVSNEYTVINSDEGLDLRFLRYLSETRYFQQTCFHSSIGVHVEKMIFKTDHWLKWPFNIPPLAQQQRIVQLLDTAGQEVISIAEDVKALKREKAALMAQLLTGKRRVRLPQAEATA